MHLVTRLDEEPDYFRLFFSPPFFSEATKKARGGFIMNMHQKAKFNFTGW